MRAVPLAFCLSLFLSSCMDQPGDATEQPGTSRKKPISTKAGSSTRDSWDASLTNMMNQIETQMPGAPRAAPQKPSQDTPSDSAQRTPACSPPNIIPTTTPSNTTTGTTIEPLKAPNQHADSIESGTTDNDSKNDTKDYFSDISKSGISRWNSTRRPLKVFIQKSSTAKGFRPEFAALLEDAFNEWAKATPAAHLSYTFGSTPREADIACIWTDNKNDMMDSLEGGITLLIPEAQGIKRADIKILTVPPNDLTSIPANYMRRIALHEVGHALGLSGHSLKAEDMMFGTIYPKDEACRLTERDKATMAALYAQPDTVVASNRIDPLRATSQFGTAATPKVRALELSNRAAKALASNQLDVALTDLEEAHKLDPTNTLIGSNLGAIYANLGSLAGMTFNFPRATTLFKKAIPLLENGPDKGALIQVLSNYLQILRATRTSPAEQKVIEAKLARFQSK